MAVLVAALATLAVAAAILAERAPERDAASAQAVGAAPAPPRALARNGRPSARAGKRGPRPRPRPKRARPYPRAGSGAWGVPAINAPGAWRLRVTGASVRVGIIDTGVDPANRALAGKVRAFRDFVNGRRRPYDDNGHGTHIAGTVAGGRAGNGPIGVAPGARLLVAKAIGSDGQGTRASLLAAAEWLSDPDGDPATDDAPQVIVNAWGGGDANDTWFRPMARRWRELGIVAVFAAGNEGPAPGSVRGPASYPETLAVGALSRSGALAPFSSRGPVRWTDRDGDGPPSGTRLVKPDLVAPGVAVVSSVGRGYQAWSGTSVAAAHVAGVAALVRQANPSLSPARVERILRRTAVDVGPRGVDARTGAGRVDALAAVRAAGARRPHDARAPRPRNVRGR